MSKRSSSRMAALTRRGFTLSAGLVASVPALANAGPSRSALTVDAMYVEWQVEPLAIDSCRPRFRWALKARSKQARGLFQHAFRLTVFKEASSSPLFDTGIVPTKEQAFTPLSALTLDAQAAYRWTVEVWSHDGAPSTSKASTFHTGLLDGSDPQGQWLTLSGDPVEEHFQAIEGHWHWVDAPEPLPIFRKSFASAQAPVSAHLLISGLGQYQAWINGRQVSGIGVNGGWTKFTDTALYDAYDVTAAIRAGQNLFGVALGNGFFNVEAVKGRYAKLSGRFGRPMVWAQLRLTYADGSTQTIPTDPSWQARVGGTSYSSIYGGEDFDARADDGSFGDHDGWKSVVPVPGPGGRLTASTYLPMQVQETFKPVQRKTVKAGLDIIDLGINHSGKPVLTFSNARPGAVVRVYPGELLSGDGLVDQASMAGGGEPGLKGIQFIYTCRGGASETWTPQFGYTGYRYLQIDADDGAMPTTVESLFLYNAVPEGGVFGCSDKRLVKIHALIRQALLSNSASVLTDCPTREKLGWLEQTYLNAGTVMNNLDAIRMLEKAARDVREAQEKSGMVPAIAPEYIKFLDKDGQSTMFRDSPEWGAAIVLTAWYTYQRYGDSAILADNFDAICHYLDYLESRRGEDGLLDFGLGDWYDIGPKHPGEAQLTSRKMTGTSTYFACIDAAAQMAGILKAPNSEALRARAASVQGVIRDKLFHPETSTLDTGSQTSQAMGLILGLFPDSHRAKALDVLVADIRAHANHVTAGDIGFHYVVRALTQFGRSDVLYAMLSQTDKPSYLQQVINGATSLTEAWDSWRDASQNHFMLGHAEIWLFGGLGGVQVDHGQTDGVTLRVAPQLVDGVDETRVNLSTFHGPVGCTLIRRGSAVEVAVSVPVGQKATVTLPRAKLKKVKEAGRALGRLSPERGIELNSDGSLLVGSGEYVFGYHIA